MTTRRAHIPLIPTDSIRVAVKVDRSVYLLAKKLKIDVHSLWRMTLQDAVDTLKEQYESPSHKSRSTESKQSPKQLHEANLANGYYYDGQYYNDDDAKNNDTDDDNP